MNMTPQAALVEALKDIAEYPDLDALELKRIARAALAQAEAAQKQEAHADDAAVDAFAAAMKAKLALARAKGRGGWQTCSPESLSEMLRDHVEKGDPRDVANFCMFLWSLGAGITAPKQEALYKVTIRGRWHEAEPTAAAFSLPDGEHLLYGTAQPQQPAPEPVAPLSDGFEQWWELHRVKRVLNPAGVARMVWEASARHNRAAAPQTPAPGAEGGDGA